MKTLSKTVSILLCAVVLGCVEQTTEVGVRKDGSGTIVQTMYMSATMSGMMKQMTMSIGGEDEVKAETKGILQPDKNYLEIASKMGEGVTFVSAKELSKPDGSQGARVEFAFTDVEKLRLGMEVETPREKDTTPSEKQEGRPVTFKFEKGASPKLTIILPKAENTKIAPTEAPQVDPAQMAMMKQVYEGLRVSMVVKLLDGEVGQSNASYIESSDGKKNSVILFDMDMGKLVQNQASFAKLCALGEMKDVDGSRALLKKEFPDLKIETNEKIEIQIK